MEMATRITSLPVCRTNAKSANPAAASRKTTIYTAIDKSIMLNSKQVSNQVAMIEGDSISIQ